MNAFETMIARYNSTLPTISDGEGQELQLTNKGVLYVTPSDLDGTSLVTQAGDDVSVNNQGFIAYGINDSNLAVAHSMDANGYLRVNVAAGSIDIDYTPGTDADASTDRSGAQTEPGVIQGITQSYVDLVTINITNGTTLAVSGIDASCDSEGQFQLVFTNQTGSSYVRTMLIPENQGMNQLVFMRAIEFTALDASTTLKLKGRALRQGREMSAAGGINAYVK